VHELGHFWAARRAGIHVEEFSIGMGPRLLSVMKNETRYSLKLLPIGGSCAMLGEDESAEGNPRSFGSKSVGWRIVVITAGAFMNFVLALLITTIVAMFVHGSDATVRGFSETSPIQEAGVQIGDRIVSVNGRSVHVYGNFALAMHRADGEPMNVVIDRQGQRHNLAITPYHTGDRYILGFIPGRVIGPFHSGTAALADGSIMNLDEQPWVHRMGFFESLSYGFSSMVYNIEIVIFSLGQLITGNFTVNDMMGPVGIVTAVGDQIEQSTAAGSAADGFWAAMIFAALISANLGVFNLLPIPALDGGRLVFLILEAIRRKPIDPNREGFVHFAGLMLLMVLIVFVTYNDILRLLA